MANINKLQKDARNRADLMQKQAETAQKRIIDPGAAAQANPIRKTMQPARVQQPAQQPQARSLGISWNDYNRYENDYNTW